MNHTLRTPIGRLDYAFAALILFAAALTFKQYGNYLDYYEQGILLGSAAGIVWLGWFWKPLRVFLPLCGLLALGAIGLYDGALANGSSRFWLKYALSSQSAVMWMCVLFFLATLMYWVGLLRKSATALGVASGLTWAAAAAAMISKLVRWYESYLIGADVGHIPVSNLYEVFILFCLITALMYLYYEARYQARSMGAFVLLVISAAVGFIIWYTFDRQAHEIQPLIPALQSWWMKIHVPANFVGYGAFAMAAMLGVAWLLAEPANQSSSQRRSLWLAAALIAVLGLGLHLGAGALGETGAPRAMFAAKFAYCAALLCVVAANRGQLASYLPAPAVLDEISYKAIAVGFLFFTIATILGAMWAADAWGGYWSWDPKETWALIVWLNYATWLHMRLVKGWRGATLAWWSVGGLFITTFAFIGVNMFLSGLHSYGGL
ncbi:c-type cytochrome biogenesis protein CcsB [Chitinilyticum piscinae]|uniref:C-type cytochrome biogenesis protein CcsB n=1 Tax=Chitinilyticum piscinae TaxID=2866724 RepID=A0A8J7FH10_9NEIS|nr:c-type cytochrome biogenesis protein CcsB [Chitinilyticum piscinae]MBE9608025.1 c-type cytochrome biogenesis protein CcsB [Chitinilyticum piscinae]